jgi:hypothetical protein
MTEDTKVTPGFSPEALAALGVGEVAYVRPIMSEELTRLFPEAPQIPPGQKLFALVSAAGAPIVVADTRDAVLANAFENDLRTVAVH